MTHHQLESSENPTKQPEVHHKAADELSNRDWERFTANTVKERVSSNPESTTFHSNVYGDQLLGNNTVMAATADGARNDSTLARDSKELRQDANALRSEEKGSAAYDKSLAQLNKDEAALKQDVFHELHSADSFKAFSDIMNQYHADLKETATELWDMGLKNEASETTAYFPLSHYEKYFSNPGAGTPPPPHDGGGNPPPGDGGNGNNPPPPPSDGGNGGNPGAPSGAIDNSNLLSNSQRPDIKRGDIGGSGNISFIDAKSTGANSDEITMVAGSKSGNWGDGLLLNEVHNSTTDKNVPQQIQLDKTFSFTADQLKHLNQYENDINNGVGMHGTQINTKTGEVDVWDAANSKWVKGGSFGGPLEAGKTYNLQIDAIDNPNGTLSYTGYYLNGKNGLDKTATFGDKPLHWAPGDYIQTQLDFDGSTPANATTGVSESNEHLYIKNL